MITPKPTYQIQRRAFLQHGVLVLTASTCTRDLMTADIEPVLRVALITDLHHADKAPVGTRHYRETMAKLTEAAGQFEQERPHILVELGDLIDAANSVEVELQYLDTINRPLSAICDERHYVLGNHCVDTLTKQEFLSAVGQPKSWYSFERSGYRFVVLDSCFRSDGEPYQRKNFTWTDANLPTE
ncbi:MAG: metallophosphoesterase, partial [Planctomycetaceae bacterium]|nr:metallophosphoesterase [Planctomycetaceae bacterium]